MDSSTPLTIMVSAGEASGDSHAAHALEALGDIHSSVNSFGMGAGALQAIGTELLVDCRDLAVIGIVDVLRNYPSFIKRLNLLRRAMQDRQPDLLLLVDYPDFNLKLAKTAKALKIPVLFYISPKVWAWRAGRVPKIGAVVSHMAVLFPFEVAIYEQANIPVTYVGNPVVHDAVSQYSREQACFALGIEPSRKVIALLPGSRKSEIQRHLQIMCDTIKLLESQISDLTVVLPIAPTLDSQFIEHVLADKAPDTLILTHADSRDVMRAADCAFVASGTATLETALIGTPMVVIYIVNGLNYAIMKRLIRIPDISLVNIVAGRRIVPEYIQHDARADIMAEDLKSLIDDKQRRTRMQADLAEVKEAMGDSHASKRVASLILKLVNADKTD